MNKEAVEKLRGNLIKKVDGFDMSESDFEKAIQDSTKRNKLYNNMLKRIDGFTMSEEEFDNILGMGKQETQQAPVEPVQEAEAPTATAAEVVAPSKRVFFWKSVFAHNPYPVSAQEEKEKEAQEKQKEDETRAKYLQNAGIKQQAPDTNRDEVKNFADFSMRTGVTPTTSIPTVGDVLKKVGEGKMTEADMRQQLTERQKVEDKAKANMSKVRQEYAQEVYDRRYQNVNGKLKDTFFGDMFDAAMAGIGTIAATPFKMIEAAEDFGIDIDNAVRGTNMQHGQGTVTRFFNDVLGVSYLRGQIDHYTKEADRYQDNKGIVESAFDGELGTAAGKAVLATIQSAPNLAVSIYSGKKGMETFGGVFLGTTAALQKYDEIKDSDISAADKALSMFGAFVSECVPEIIGAKRYGKFFNKQTVGTIRKETQQEVLKGWQKFVNSKWAKEAGIAWDWFFKYFGEGTTEAMTDIMNLGIDLALGIKDEVTKQDLMSIGDSFIVGQLSDIGPSAVHFYQQNKYKGAVEREIINNPMLSGITQRLGTTPDKIAEVSSKRMFQENISDKDAELFNNYQDAIGKRVNEIKCLSAVIEEAGLTGNPVAYLAYNMASKELSISDEQMDAILTKPTEDITEEESALLKNLSAKMSEIAGTEAFTIAAKGRSVPRTLKSIVVTGANGRRTRASVWFEGEGVVFNDDGSIDAIHSNNLSLKTYKGEEITGQKRAEWIESLNAVLRNEFAESTARAEVEKLAKQRAEEAKANQEKQEAAKEQARKQMIAEISKDIPMDGDTVNAKKATPAQTFVWNLQRNGQEEAMTRAARAVGRNMLDLEMLKEGTGMSPEEQDAAIDRANIRIAGYKKVIGDILGEQSVQQLERDAEGQFAQFLKEKHDEADEKERARLARIAEKQRIREENRKKFAENLQESEKSSTFAQNLGGNDNTGVQQQGERGNQTPQSQPDNSGLAGDRGGISTDGRESNESGEPTDLRGRITPLDSLDSLNEEIDSKLRAKGINSPAVRVVRVGSQDFHDAIVRGRALNLDGWRVDVKEVEDYDRCYCILTEDGCAGIAVKEDGDIVSLFSDNKHLGVSRKLLLAAIGNNGRKADFFMSPGDRRGLQNRYWRFGARITGQNPFSEEVGRQWVAGWPEYYDRLVGEKGDDGRVEALNHPTAAAIFPATIDEAVEAFAQRNGKMIEKELGVEKIADGQEGLKGVPVYDDYDDMITKRDEELANPKEEEREPEQEPVVEEALQAEPIDLRADDIVLMVQGMGGSATVYTWARKQTDENGNETYINLGCPVGPHHNRIPKTGSVLGESWHPTKKENKEFYVKDQSGEEHMCYAISKEELGRKYERGSDKFPDAVYADTNYEVQAVTSMLEVYVKSEKDGVEKQVSLLKGESSGLKFNSIKALLDHKIVVRNEAKALNEGAIIFKLYDLLYGKYASADNAYATVVSKLIEAAEGHTSGLSAYTTIFNQELKKMLRAWNSYCKDNGYTNINPEEIAKLDKKDRNLFWSARAIIAEGNVAKADKASLEISPEIDGKKMRESKYMRNNPLHQLGVMLYIANKLGYVNGIEFTQLPGKSGMESNARVRNVDNIVTKDDILAKRERYRALKKGAAKYNLDMYNSLEHELEVLEKYYPEVLNDEPVHNRREITFDNEKKVAEDIHNNKLQDEAAKELAKKRANEAKVANMTEEELQAEQENALQKAKEEGSAAIERAAAAKDNAAFQKAVLDIQPYIEGDDAAHKRVSDMVAAYIASITPVVEEEKPKRKPRKKAEKKETPKVEEQAQEPAPAEPVAETQAETTPEEGAVFNPASLDGMTEDQLKGRRDDLWIKNDMQGLTAEEEAELAESDKRIERKIYKGSDNNNKDVEGGFKALGELSVSPEQKAKSAKSQVLGQFLTNVINRVKGIGGVHVLNSKDEMMNTLFSLLGTPEFSIRKEAAPKKTGIGYKVFYRGKDGKLYPPMVANPNGEDTPVGVWLNADAAPVAGESKTGRQKVKAGGKGTQGGSGQLAYRPGWHLGEIPYALQFNRKDENGEKTLFPKDFVWAVVEYAADNDYQEEAMREGVNASGKFQHSLAGLKHVPTDGFYRYRTNPNPETDPWIITGAMKVNRILTNEEVDEMVRAAGREPQKREGEVEYLKDPKGTIYGFAVGNEIYLSPEGMNADTPIHEYTHLWVKTLRMSDPNTWKKIVAELKRNKALWESVTNDENYKDLTTYDAIASEVLARYSGEKGAELLEKLAADQKFGSEKLEQAFLNRVRRSLRSFWQWIAEKIFHRNINSTEDIDSIADWVLRDLFDGKELDLTDRKILEEMDSIKKEAIENGTFMKAPNGMPSNLPEQQWMLVRTENFKKWFGDWINDPLHASKVVDENGEPLVVYHGTNKAGFDTFSHPEAWYTKGFYTTDNRHVASGYTKSDVTEIPTDAQEAVIGDDAHEGVYSLFVNMKNPMYVDFADEEGNKRRYNEYPSGKWVVYGDESRGIEERTFDSEEDAKAYAEQFGGVDYEQIMISTDKFMDKAAEAGFDGCVFTNVYDGNFTIGEDITDYVALSPNQLKSIHNKGYFSTIDDRIEYQYTLEALNEHNETATAAVERASELASAMGDVLSEDGIEQSRLSNAITKCLDQMEGMRVLQDNLAAYRRTKCEEPLPDKYDIRNKFESKDSISMNKIRQFNHTIAGELNEVVVKLADIVKDSVFYQQHKKEVGGENPTTLSCVEFIGRYLIARNDYERAKEGVARGMATFEQRMGMSTEQFWRGFHEAYDQSLILELWDKIRAITTFELKTAVEGGLITQEEYERLMEKQFYVPQRGFWDNVNPENEGENELRVVRDGGKSKIELSSMKKAKGGKSLAENPLVYIYRDAQEAIIKSENNKVKVALYDMLRENRDWCAIPEVGISVPATVTYTQVDGNWEKLINGYSEKDAKEKASLERRLEDAKFRLNEAKEEQKNILLDLINDIEGRLAELEAGRIENEFSASDNRIIYSHKNKSDKRNTVGVLIDGIQHEITLPKNFTLTAQAFNGVNNRKGVLDTIRTWSSFMAAQFTVNNPTFWSVNLVRDIGFVTLKGGAEYGWEFEKRFYHYLRTCQKSLNGYLWNGYVKDGNSEESAWLKEFLDYGGNTGLFNNLDLEKFRYDVRKMSPEAKEGKEKKLSRLADTVQWAMLQPVANYLNEWSELTSRFAIFCAIKKMGMSTNEAVKASHNLSVNFNRRGLGWELLNAFSSITVFVNATLQGSSGFWRTFGAGYGANKTEKIKQFLKAGCVMASLPMFLGAMNALLLPDDDDEERRVSDWDRDNYICLPNGFKIALPQEIRPFWCMGSNIGLMMRGSRTWRQVLSSVLKSMMTNALPIPQNISNAAALGVDNFFGDEYHNTGELLRTVVTPSFMETLGQIAENKNFLGGKLRYDFKDWPEYEMAPNESIFYRDLSYAMYRVGGGDPYVASKHRSAELGSKMSKVWDINPKQIKPWLFFIPSGTMDAWVTLWGGGRAAIDAATGKYDEDKNYVQWKDALIANRFYRPINKDAFRYTVKKQAKAIIDEYDAIAGNAKDNIVREAALGNTKKEEAAIERYQKVLIENAGIIEEMKSYMQTLNSISRRSLQNRLKLMNDSELKDVVGIESYNTLDDEEKDVILKLVYDINVIQGIANPPQNIEDIKVIE